jgi:hypothetical protein
LCNFVASNTEGDRCRADRMALLELKKRSLNMKRNAALRTDWVNFGARPSVRNNIVVHTLVKSLQPFIVDDFLQSCNCSLILFRCISALLKLHSRLDGDCR